MGLKSSQYPLIKVNVEPMTIHPTMLPTSNTSTGRMIQIGTSNAMNIKILKFQTRKVHTHESCISSLLE
jgi:hypothetical protein